MHAFLHAAAFLFLDTRPPFMTAFDSNRQKTSSVTSYHIGLVSLIRQAQGSSLEIHANPGNKAVKLPKILLFEPRFRFDIAVLQLYKLAINFAFVWIFDHQGLKITENYHSTL